MADSPYTGTARGTGFNSSAKPGRLANPPSGGGIMNMTTPSNSGGKPYVSTSKYAASPRGTECQDTNDADDA